LGCFVPTYPFTLAGAIVVFFLYNIGSTPAAPEIAMSGGEGRKQLRGQADCSTWAGRKAPNGREIPARVLL